MALEGYKSNHNVVNSSKCHCVWVPKYRRAVLVGPMAKGCEPVLRQAADKYRVTGRDLFPRVIRFTLRRFLRFFAPEVGGIGYFVV
jgi:hypothetical protein